MTKVIPARSHPWRKGYMHKPPKGERKTLTQIPFACLFATSAFRYRVWRRGGKAYFSLEELADILALDKDAAWPAPYVSGQLYIGKEHGQIRARLV